jgi:2,5-furandicarboxylate decarboxylase 1
MDLRTFLRHLEAHGQLARIATPVDLKHELANVAVNMERRGMPAPLFTAVRGAGMPVVAGVLASHQRIALALNCAPHEVTDRVGEALERSVPPVEVANPPCQEQVALGEEASLDHLPIPTHGAEDGGAFITGGVVFSRHPPTGRQNVSYHRFQIKGRAKTGIQINQWRHLNDSLRAAEAEGRPVPIAIAIGVDPVLHIGAGIRSDRDEAHIAGALAGEPIAMARCVASDLLVPASSEIVVEGEILPGVREAEGPMAEFTGHYSSVWEEPVVRVTAITHRRDPIFQTIVPAAHGHINLGTVVPREPILKRMVRYVSKNVTQVHIPPVGCGFTAYIGLDKKHPGEPRNVALAALTTYVNIKIVIVFDPDVDLYDPNDVLWALSTRVDPVTDICTIPQAQGHEMDPTSDRHGVQNKMVIDATLSAEKRALYKRCGYPAVDLGKYLAGC